MYECWECKQLCAILCTLWLRVLSNQVFVAVFSGGEPSEDCVRQRLSSGLRAVQQTLAGGDHKTGSLSLLPASGCPRPHHPHPWHHPPHPWHHCPHPWPSTCIPDTTARIPDITAHVPDITAPIPDTTTPIPDITAPIPDITAPIPDTTTPIPDTTAPIPDTPTSLTPPTSLVFPVPPGLPGLQAPPPSWCDGSLSSLTSLGSNSNSQERCTL